MMLIWVNKLTDTASRINAAVGELIFLMEYVSRIITPVQSCFHSRDIFALLNKNAVKFCKSHYLPLVIMDLEVIRLSPIQTQHMW